MRFCHRSPQGLHGHGHMFPRHLQLGAPAGLGIGTCPVTMLIGNQIHEARGCIWCTCMHILWAGANIGTMSCACAIAHARGLLVDAQCHGGGGWCAVILKAHVHQPWQAVGTGAGSMIPSLQLPGTETKLGPLRCWPCIGTIGWQCKQVAGCMCLGLGLFAALEGPGTRTCPGTMLIGNQIQEAHGCI